MTPPAMNPNLLWTQPAWLAQAHAWIDASLTASGYQLTGPVDQFHSYLWSTVMRVPTDAGRLYFKACEPPTEVRLTAFLSGIQPENVPDLVAVDLQRGWMLMRDAGPMLRTYLKTTADLAMIAPAMEQFARLQIAVARQQEYLISLGVMERRLDRLPGMFATMLSEPEILRLGFDDGLSGDQHRQLLDLLPRYEEMCARLQGYGIPPSLHHDDFHDGNIFVSGAPENYRFVFSDWGESLITHPFFSIMLTLRSVCGGDGLPDEAAEAPDRMPPELNSLRDAYLRPWQAYGSPDRLIEIFNLAWRVGMVSRALTWRAYVLSLDPARRTDFTYIVPAWLGEFLIAMK